MILARRRLLFGAGALLAAPAIVRVSSIMPVSVLEPNIYLWGDSMLRPETWGPVFEGGTNDVTAVGMSGQTATEIEARFGKIFVGDNIIMAQRENWTGYGNHRRCLGFVVAVGLTGSELTQAGEQNALSPSQ